MSSKPFDPRVSRVAAFGTAAACAVVTLLAMPQYPQTPGSACPAGHEREEAAEYAREHGFTDGQRQALVARAGESFCLPAKYPESLTEIRGVIDERARRSGVPPQGALRKALAQRDAMIGLGAQQKVAGAAGEWTEYGSGPLMANDPEFGTYGFGWTTLNGRIDSFEYDLAARRLFATVGTGGVWVSEDNGDSWRSIGDNLPSQVIGAVGWTPAGGGTVIVSGGEPLLIGGFSFTGYGAYWSNDLGETWHHADGIPDGLQSFQVAVDHSRPDVVYVATSHGLFRSTDAGRTYVDVALPTSPDCAGVSDYGKCQYANVVTDVVVKEPGGTTAEAGGQVLAAVGWAVSSLRTFPDGTQHAPGNGLYRSDTGEPGTFTRLEVSGDNVSPLGFPTPDRVGRTEFGQALGPGQDHNYVYAIVQDAQLISGGLQGIDAAPVRDFVGVPNSSYLNGLYVSPDFGSSWLKLADTNEIAYNAASGSSLTALSALFAPGVQAWYNMWIKPDPTRQDGAGVPTRLAFGLEEVWRNRITALPLDGLTQAGPNDFEVIGKYFLTPDCVLSVDAVPLCQTRDTPLGGTTLHPDQHDAIWVAQDDGGVCLFAGGDGGVFRQCAGPNEEVDQAGWGDGANQGFNTLLPYSVAAAKDGTVWWGHQDNGSGKTEPQGRRIMTFGGDGFYAAVDPDNSDIAYSETTSASMRATVDGGRTWQYIGASPTNALFANPFVMDPTDARHLMVGATTIHETVDGPATCTNVDPAGGLVNCTWAQVFNLGNNPDGEPYILSALDLEADAAYVGFCGKCDVFTPNGPFRNGIATNVGGDQPPQRMTNSGWHIAAAQGLQNRFISGVEIDPNDPRTVYVTLAGYDNAQWVPPGSYLDTTENVGTGHVFKSTDAGETFTDVTGNLPNVPAHWVTLRPTGQLLVGTDIGTFISSDTNGTEWAPLGTGLPNAPVWMMQIDPADPNAVYAATFGRGIYRYEFKDGAVVVPGPGPVVGGAAGEQRFGGALGWSLLAVLGGLGLLRRRPRA